MKKAFSLFELLIVVAIIATIYTIAIKSFVPQKKRKDVAIKEMKQFLTKNYGYNIELICIMDCKKCYLKTTTTTEEIEQNFGFKENLTVYFINENYNEFKPEFGNFEDSEICMRYKISKKGVSEPMIVQNGENFYTIPSFIGEVKEFKSMSEAIDWYRKIKYNLEDIY